MRLARSYAAGAGALRSRVINVYLLLFEILRINECSTGKGEFRNLSQWD